MNAPFILEFSVKASATICQYATLIHLQISNQLIVQLNVLFV